MIDIIALALAPVPVDFDRLSAGRAPQVAWYSNGVIRDGDDRIQVGDRSVSGFVQVKGGIAARVRDADETAKDSLLLFKTNGSVRVLATAPGDSNEIFGPAVSADGRRMAWSVVENLDSAGGSGDMTSTLVIAGSNGTPLARKTVRDDLWVKGLVGDRVILNRGSDSGTLIWRTDRGVIGEWRDASEVTAVSNRTGLAAVADGSGCTTVREVGTSRQLWRTCSHRIVGFSPDGRYAVTKKDVDNSTVLIGLRKARSGERVLELRTGGGTPEVAWEPGGDVLVTAWDSSKMAIVRCTTSGTCEFAQPPRPTSAGWPYLLPDQ